jgi:hydroxyacylglutathione hydrolase
MTIPLEDNFTDILGKAIRGLKLTPTDLASRAGVPPSQVQRLCEGELDENVLRKVAPLLGLNADALLVSARKAWRPEPIALDGLAQFNTPFDDMTVNSYLVWDPSTAEAAAFDTGADCSGMLELLAQKKLRLKSIFLTHTHGDHVFDLDRLKSKTGASAYVSEEEPLAGAETFSPGRAFRIGNLRVETRLTSGHSRGGITYIISGLARSVGIVGDSIFAGSMGGGMVSYEAALHNNLEKVLTLPSETILCPGHGPLTTVAEEKQHNPFFRI